MDLMISERDDELLGVSNAIDGMGVLAVWTQRARDVIPHLTAQTVSARGFQVLVEAFRLWEDYRKLHPEHSDKADDFFILVEQAFARTVARQERWSLPGARRAQAGMDDPPCISVSDRSLHLLDNQKGNGLWGLYRGAAGRAGLLDETLLQLAPAMLALARQKPLLEPTAQRHLFDHLHHALEGNTEELPTDFRNSLPRMLFYGFRAIPFRDGLWDRLIATNELTDALAHRLLGEEEIDYRRVLADVGNILPEHRPVLTNLVRCENFLSVLETVFIHLCANPGRDIEVVAEELPLDPSALGDAREKFADSGRYVDVGSDRRDLFVGQLDVSDRLAVTRSVLAIHERVAGRRARAVWAWEEDGRLLSDMDFAPPDDDAMVPGVAWRNDYFFSALRSVASMLDEARQ